MKLRGIALSMVLSSGIMTAQTFNCDMSGYRPAEGLKAEVKGTAVVLTWQGEAGQQLQAQFSLRGGEPMVQQLAARSSSGPWIVLGKNLTPDCHVTTAT